MDIAELVIRISAVTDDVETAFGQAQQMAQEFAKKMEAATAKAVSPDIKKGFEAAAAGARAAGSEIAAATEKAGEFGSEAERSASEAAKAWETVSAAAKTALDKITGAVDEGIAASEGYRNAMLGLNSVATAKGIGAEEMQAALDSVTDSFFSATDASTAFKNLLTRGFTLDQAVDTITRLKDSAAFGRQASLGFAEAIVSATEGIRNENSALVDNAGVTKNVAKMWEAYAKARGLAAADLTQAQKVEAEYLGIMDETATQLGDFQKLTETLSGSQAEAAQKSADLARSFGDAMTPIVAAGTEIKTGVLAALEDIVDTFPGITAGMTAAGVAMTSFIAIASGLAKVKTLLDKINTLMAGASISTGALAAVAAVIGVAVSAYTALKNAQEEQERAARASVAESQETARAHLAQAENIQKMADRYQELRQKQRTLAEQDEFIKLQGDLAAALGVTTDKILAQAESVDVWSKAIATATQKAHEEAAKSANDAAFAQTNIALAAASEFKKSVGIDYGVPDPFQGVKWINDGSIEAFEKFKTETLGSFSQTMDSVDKGLAARAKEGLDPALQGVILQMFMDGLFGGEDAQKTLHTYSDEKLQGLLLTAKGAIQDADYSAITAGMEGQAGILESILGLDEAGRAQAVEQSQAYGEAVLQALQPMFEAAGFTERGDQIAFLNEKVLQIPLIDKAAMSVDVYSEALADLGGNLVATAAEGQKFSSSFSETFDKLQNQTENLTNMKSLAGTTREAFEAFKKLNEEGEDTGQLLELLNTYGKQLGMTTELTMDNIDEWGRKLEKVDDDWTRILLSAGEGYQSFLQEVQKADDALLSDGFTPNDEAAHQAFQAILNDGEAVKEMFAALGEFDKVLQTALLGDMSPEEAAEEMAPLLETIRVSAAEAFEAFGMSGEQAAIAADNFCKSLTNSQGVQEFVTDLQAANGVVNLSSIGLGQYSEMIKKTDSAVRSQTGQKQALDTMKNLAKQYKEGTKAGKDVSNVQQLLEKTAKAAGVSLEYENGRIKNLDKSIEASEKTLQASAVANKSAIEDTIAALEAEKQAKIDASGGTIDVDTDPAIKSINAAIKVLQFFLALMGQAGLGDGNPPPKGGGGGGKKDDAEAAAREAERKRKEALEADYRMIDHKRHLNQITLEEELAMLEKIRKKHQMNAEEIMEWEEKVYDVKKAIRERDSGSIDKMADGVITALTNRYQAMLDAENGRLDASKKAWQQWSDDSVKAIQDQIDALDALSKTEDREKQDQEELRKIAKLRQDVEFEQDEYNRMKLQQQLDQAISSRDDRLRRQAIDDQKDALRAEITAIEERAAAEIGALDEEQEALQKAYAERMKTAALQAEAEKLIMSSTQQELIDLIGEFAPEYDALGKTLGEKLLDGFQKKVGNVVNWFKKLNDSLYSIQEQAAADAIAASEAFYSNYTNRQNEETAAPATTVVQQTVNFNEPVDSAGQAALRLQQANEDLGALLNG